MRGWSEMVGTWQSEFESKKIVIWGASRGGEQAAGLLRQSGYEVEAFCDNNKQKQGGYFQNARIISPEMLLNKISRGGVIVVIASFAFEVIFRQIRDMGIDCPVYIYLLYDPCHLKKPYHYTEEERQRMYSLYVHEEYTLTLLRLIAEKGFLNEDAFGKVEDYQCFGGIDEYYYDEIAHIITEKKEPLTLVDAGTFVGDSVIQIKKVFGELLRKTYGFEPNEENCREIRKKNLEDFTLIAMGLSNKNGFLNFTENGCFFHVSETGEGVSIPVVRLDDQPLDIVGRCILKMDIEGAERLCLEGAREFIVKYRPYMAVCLYHRERDIFEIPEYILQIDKNYKFYLRGGMHTVCYAFPIEG